MDMTGTNTDGFPVPNFDGVIGGTPRARSLFTIRPVGSPLISCPRTFRLTDNRTDRLFSRVVHVPFVRLSRPYDFRF